MALGYCSVLHEAISFSLKDQNLSGILGSFWNEVWLHGITRASAGMRVGCWGQESELLTEPH